MAEDLGERTEQPTGRRLSQARRRGQIAKSQDLGAAIDLIGGLLLIIILGASIFAGLLGLTRQLLDWRDSDTPGGSAMGGGAGQPFTLDWLTSTLLWVGKETVIIAAPVLLATFLISALAQFLQVGPLFTTEPMRPKFNKLNPVSGLSKLFSRRSLVKLGLNLLKLAALGGVASMVLWSMREPLAKLSMLDAAGAFWLIGVLLVKLLTWMLAVLLIIALLDFWYQRWQHTRDLRMTKQEVKDEHRSMEGDVETKGRRLRLAREMAMQRLRQAVPTADVVVVNPTHFSVALRYEDGMAAPKVVAKGADFLAFRIREIAAANGIPIVERPPLARALYHGVPVGRLIPSEFYEAVAEILAYVYRLKENAA